MAEMEPGAQASAEGGGGGGMMELVQNIMKGMSILGEGLQSAGAPPEALSELEALMGGFESFVSKLGGGGGEEPAPQKSKAVPVQESQGRPVGPGGV
jgi:hypothetical protein